MKLLPYNAFTLHAYQSPAEVATRLGAYVETPRLRWGFSHNHPPYAGTISTSGFEIRRIIHYRNSFIPQIRGRFEELPRGTNVRIAMGLHPFVKIFLLFWFSVWYGIFIPVSLSGAGSGDLPKEAGLFLGLPLVMLVVFWCAFWYEAKRSQQELTNIILGEPLGSKTAGNSTSRTLLIVGAIAVIAIWNAIFLGWIFSSDLSRESQLAAARPCSQAEAASPYCNFALLHSLKGHPTANAIALSNDGKILATGGRDKAIKVWDLQTGELKKTLQSDSGEILSVAIAPDNQTIVSGSGDRMVRIWNIADGGSKMLKGHNANIGQVKIAADGKTAVSASYDTIKVWDLATGELKATRPDASPGEIQIGPVTVTGDSPHVRVFHISADGKKVLAEINSKLAVWDLATNEQTTIPTSIFAYTNAARLSPDGKTAITTSYTQPKTTLKIWDLSSGSLKAEGVISTARESWGYSDRLALSRDRVLTSTPQGIQVWNLQTAAFEATILNEPLRNLLVSPDGKLLVGTTGDASSQNTQIKVWQR